MEQRSAGIARTKQVLLPILQCGNEEETRPVNAPALATVVISQPAGERIERARPISYLVSGCFGLFSADVECQKAVE